LVVFSGVDNHYKNVLFGLAFINNELQATYNWVLKEFDSIMNEKPVLIMSDQDLSLGAAIKHVYPDIEHRLCAWQKVRNLRRKFGFLKEEFEDLKKKIFGLPSLYSKKQFQDHINEIMTFLKDQALEKSEKYLENLMQNKSQWARSCYNNSFDANICTTSRVESWNAVLKKYLNSHSKISDIIAFIEETEKTYLSKQLKISKDIYQLLEYDSLLKNLKVILPSRVYEKHIVQYNLGKRDYEKVRGLEEDGIPVFDVIFNGK